ncbi:MAG: hypothetical protein WCB04_09560 [Mycobacteriales bacterium]
MSLNSGVITKVALVAGGLVAGAVLAGTVAAQAAPSATPSAASSSATDPHPGDNGADGVQEAQEHHGPHHGLALSGTVKAVGTNTVTIQTTSGTTVYSVVSSSDIDKNGEAKLSSLVVGDKVMFSVDSTKTKQIDKLHAGDEAKNMPMRPAN